MNLIASTNACEVESTKESGTDNIDIRGQYIPPLLFACVTPGVFRGCYPKDSSIPFLMRMKLKTIVSVTPDPLPLSFLTKLGSDLNYIHIAGEEEQKKSKKKKSIPINFEIVNHALAILNNSDMQPVFVHCLNGKQATSLIIACYRISHGWSLRSALAEYTRFSDYARPDIAFLENYHDCSRTGNFHL